MTLFVGIKCPEKMNITILRIPELNGRELAILRSCVSLLRTKCSKLLLSQLIHLLINHLKVKRQTNVALSNNMLNWTPSVIILFSLSLLVFSSSASPDLWVGWRRGSPGDNVEQRISWMSCRGVLWSGSRKVDYLQLIRAGDIKGCVKVRLTYSTASLKNQPQSPSGNLTNHAAAFCHGIQCVFCCWSYLLAANGPRPARRPRLGPGCAPQAPVRSQVRTASGDQSGWTDPRLCWPDFIQ